LGFRLGWEKSEGLSKDTDLRTGRVCGYDITEIIVMVSIGQEVVRRFKSWG